MGDAVRVALSPEDERARRDELNERLRWLIRLRWIALAGVFLVVGFSRYLDLLHSSLPLLLAASAMAVLNIGFFAAHLIYPLRGFGKLTTEALLQIGIDVTGLGLLLFFSGGVSNPFVFFFTFHCVIAAILLDKPKAYFVALLSCGVVFILGLADELGLSRSWPLRGLSVLDGLPALARFGWVFALSTTLLISVYMVTNIMESLRARTSDVRRLNRDLGERVALLAAAERKLAAEHQRARAILECMKEGVVVVDLHGAVILANSAALHSALLNLPDGTRAARSGVQPAPALSRPPAAANCPGPLAQCSLLNRDDAPLDGRNETVLTHHADDEAGRHCTRGHAAACLHDALSHNGHLCPATLALLGAPLPAEDSGPQPPRLTPPDQPQLTQLELQGRTFENTISAVRAPNGETLGLVIVSRDVTERRMLERQVVHSEKLHALGNLAAGLAHELNTPLGTILGYAQMLLDERPANELKIIEDQARRCRKIVQGLLSFARKSSGERTRVAPNELAAKVSDLLAHSLRTRGIALQTDLAQPEPPPLRLAADEIEQVLVNLVTNAADAVELQRSPEAQPAEVGHSGSSANGLAANGAVSGSANGSGGAATGAGGTVRIETRVDSKGRVVLAVEDDGPGVPPELREQIFEPFFTTKAAGRGTGLGLSIARRIVEDHDGELRLTVPENGRGARFELRLPAPS